MLEGLALSGRYRLDEFIGQGGMGEVWRATDLHLRRRVAVKVLPLNRSSDGTAVERFRREAEIGASLIHRGITVVHDFGTHEERQIIFLVMEFLDGENLRQRMLREPSGLPFRTVRDLGVQIAVALAAAHSSNVIHRDVKPANLMLLPDGAIKICDFGIARYNAATSATTSAMVGTPLFMAPEQFDSRPVDGRTDVYALGCVLYMLTTGEPPFNGDLASVMYQHLQAAPQRLTVLRHDVPPDLERLVLACLEKNPAQRPPTAQAVADALLGMGAASQTGPGPSQTFGAGTGRTAPVAPWPPGGRSGRGRVIGAAALAVALVAVLGVGIPLYLNARGKDEASGRSSSPGATRTSPSASPTPTVQKPSFIPPTWSSVPVTVSTDDGCSTTPEGARLTTNDKTIPVCGVTEEKIDDVGVQATIGFPAPGSCGGFFVRRAGAPSYYFQFCGDGGFKASYWKSNQDADEVLTSKPRFQSAESIRAGVLLVKDQFKVYVDGNLLWSGSDDTLTSAGTVALTADSSDELIVDFKEISVWRAKAQGGA